MDVKSSVGASIVLVGLDTFWEDEILSNKNDIFVQSVENDR